MGLFDKVKAKFHHDSSNKNRMMETENNKQEFNIPTDDKPRNRMMDTVSNEQGAQYAQQVNNPGGKMNETGVNKNLMTHTLSNEQAELLASGNDIMHDNEPPKNKLFDIQPNEGTYDNNVPNYKTPQNSDRLL